MKPEIILFDEPTSALDPTMISEVPGRCPEARRRRDDHARRHPRDEIRPGCLDTRLLPWTRGPIFEEGTPEQIFEKPIRDKTRAFIHKIRTFVFEIRSRAFDLYALNAGIEAFGRRQFLAEKEIYNIQLVLEELILHKLLGKLNDPLEMTVSVGHSEASGEVELTLDYAGDTYNPLEDGDDDLSLKIIRNFVKGGACSGEDGKSRLKLTL